MQKFSLSPSLYLLSGLLILQFLSCAEMEVKNFSEPSQDFFTQLTQPQGVAVFAKSILDESEIVNLFGVKLLEKGILPVYFAVQNNTPQLSLIVPAESVRIGKNKDGAFDESPEEASHKTSEVATVIGSVLVNPMLMLLGAHQRSDASIIKENFEKKDFGLQPLTLTKKQQGSFILI